MIHTDINAKFTCKFFYMDKGGKKHPPKEIKLLGEKTKPEPAQHIIEFPGGAIEVSRCSDGVHYWAHIHINQFWADRDCDGLFSTYAEVVDSRINNGKTISEIENQQDVVQIAVLIKPIKKLPEGKQ